MLDELLLKYFARKRYIELFTIRHFDALVLFAFDRSQQPKMDAWLLVEDIQTAMGKTKSQTEILKEIDLHHLPVLVQNYLRYIGVVGKPKVQNVKIVFEGKMRSRGKDWLKFTSEQYNFFEDPARLFFMKAKLMGLPTFGYHAIKKMELVYRLNYFPFFPSYRLTNLNSSARKPSLFSTTYAYLRPQQ